MLKWPVHNHMQIMFNTVSACHVQDVKCHFGKKGQLSYWELQSWNHDYVNFILLAETITG